MATSEPTIEAQSVTPRDHRGAADPGRTRRSFALPLTERARLFELLDRPAAGPNEVGRNLRDLARLNRLPGGAHASVAAVARLGAADMPLTILDVGAGLGDIPLAFARRGWRTVATDNHPRVLEQARAATTTHELVEVFEADCRALPFDDGAFDVTHCSLLLHHLDRDDAVRALREMARVSRAGIVVNDVRRGLLPFVATGVAVAILGRCRATRVDGLTSVRRAYTLPELDELLAAAGLEVVWRSNPFMPRVVTAAIPRVAR